VKRKRQYQVSITKGGYFYIVITLLISVGAVNTGNNLLYLVSSALLAVMLISGLSSFANLKGVKVEAEPPKEAFAKIPAPVTVTLRRMTTVLPSVLLSVGIEGRSSESLFVSSGEKVSEVVWLVFHRRGKHRLESLELWSGFPFGFFVRTRRLSIDLPILVFPHPTPAQVIPACGQGKGEMISSTRKGPGDEPLDLREYQQGDPLKLMDWKASARRGRPVVREMSQQSGDELKVLLPSKPQEDELEKAAYLVIQGLKQGLKVGMVLGEREIPCSRGEDHRLTLLKALALA